MSAKYYKSCSVDEFIEYLKSSVDEAKNGKKKITKEEAKQVLIDAGIIDEDGKLVFGDEEHWLGLGPK